MIIDAQNLEFGNDDIIELPPVPEDYQKQLQELGGFSNGYPNVRIVSGLDPDIKDFNGGKWWLRYSFNKTEKVEYTILHKHDGSKQILSNDQARILKNPQGVLIPVSETKVIEIPIPRYFVETYKPPHLFGTKKEWETERKEAMKEIFEDEGKIVDLMGDYPENGQYETWFCIEDIEVDENGMVDNTKLRYLDDEVMLFIAHKIKESKKPAVQQFKESLEATKAQEAKKIEELGDRIADAVKDRINRIQGTIQIPVS